jgi:HEAT repeat protein
MSPLATEGAIQMLASVLADPGASYEEKRGAVDGLASCGLRAVPMVLDLLARPDVEGGQLAKDIIYQSDAVVWSHYARAFSNQPAKVRRALVSSIGYEFEEGTIKLDLLVTALNDYDPGVQAAAAESIERYGESARVALPRLVELAGSPDPSVKTRALRALASIGPDHPGVGDVAAGALASDSEELRMAALRALRGTPDSGLGHFETLAPMLGRESWGEERSLLCTVFANMGEPALPRLLELLRDGGALVRRGAGNAIVGMLDASRLAEDLARAKDGDPVRAPRHDGVTPKVVKIDITAQLLAALDDSDSEVRGNASEALLVLGDRAVSPLLAALATTDVDRKARLLAVAADIARDAAAPDPRLVPGFRAAIESGDLRLTEPGHAGMIWYPAAALALAKEYAPSGNIDLRYAGVTIMYGLFTHGIREHGIAAIDHVVKTLEDDNHAIREHSRECAERMLRYGADELAEEPLTRLRLALAKSIERDGG